MVPARCFLPLTALTGSWLLPCGPGSAGELQKFICANPSSGATWTISVDYDRHLADSFPASITGTRITWHDTLDGGLYELERSTGALTVRHASSTGGYALHDQCRAAH